MSDLPFSLESEISKFRAFAGESSAFGAVTTAGPDILKYTPTQKSGIKVGFLALVHGNETIGLPIVNTLLQGLTNGLFKTNCEILFGLGNLPAAFANRRFLEKDLNRCFGRADVETGEDRRAREIEKHLLDEVDYLIDLHQTVQPNTTPFFIFQYSSESCFNHLAMMNSKYPTILQFDAIGDSQNLSTDEYLRARRRFGVALELGQIGLGQEKFDVGVSVCLGFLERLKRFESFGQLDVRHTGAIQFPLFEITERILAPADGSTLDSKWINFAGFEKDQVLGRSPQGPIKAPRPGCALFPKLNQTLAQGQNMLFVCSEIKIERTREVSL